MKKVLVIEDDEAIRENTAELLSVNDYDVQTAENGTKGYNKAKACLPDVVLCDMMMPETDGFGFLQLMQKDRTLSQVPIIFFSAGTLPVEVQSRLVRAAQGFLTKPFTKEELLRAIEGVSKMNGAAPPAEA